MIPCGVASTETFQLCLKIYNQIIIRRVQKIKGNGKII